MLTKKKLYLLTYIFASGLTTTKQQQLQENILINSADISSDISDGADIIKLTPPTNNDSDISFADENINQLNTDQLHKTKNLNQSSSSPKVTTTPSPIVSPKIPHPDVIFEEPEKDEDDEEEEDYFKTNSNDKSKSKQKADNNLLTQPPIKNQTNIASINRENNLAVAQTTATATASISTSQQQQQHIKPAIEVPASNSTSVQNSKIPDRKNASPPEIKGN